MGFKVSKKGEKFIDDLAKTDTVRELARVLLAYMSVEQMAQLIATFIYFKAKGGEEEEAVNFYIKDQFFSLLKTTALSLVDLLPDMLLDVEFMKQMTKLYGNKIDLKRLLSFNKKK